MRCPKCGFISFDQLPKCVKCGKSFSSIADLVHGTAFSVSAPLFLKIQEVTETKAFGDDIKISDEMAEEFEVQDPDLEILFENEEGETGAEPSALQMDAVDDTALKEEIESSLEFGKGRRRGRDFNRSFAIPERSRGAGSWRNSCGSWKCRKDQPGIAG